MLKFQKDQMQLVGSAGTLPVSADDEITQRLAMLFEGECEGVSISHLADKYDFSRQRYYQLLEKFHQGGAAALQSQKTGPKRSYRRTQEVVRQIIRLLFLDRQASAEVVAQKLRQLSHPISIRSVRRVIAQYGLQKKTPHRRSATPRSAD